MIETGIARRRDNAFTRDSVLMAVRIPKQMRGDLLAFCQSQELTSSQAIRRAVRHELQQSGFLK
jgi:hypothetical protein